MLLPVGSKASWGEGKVGRGQNWVEGGQPEESISSGRVQSQSPPSNYMPLPMPEIWAQASSVLHPLNRGR